VEGWGGCGGPVGGNRQGAREVTRGDVGVPNLGHVVRVGQLRRDVELEVCGVGHVAVAKVENHLATLLEGLLQQHRLCGAHNTHGAAADSGGESFPCAFNKIEIGAS
jgi:hypothetical protein